MEYSRVVFSLVKVYLLSTYYLLTNYYNDVEKL